MVPPGPFRRAFDQHLSDLEELVAQAREGRVPRDTYLGYAKEAISRWLAPIFEVSQAVITKGIELSGMEDEIP